MKFETTFATWQRIALMKSAASTDAARPILCGINIEAAGESLTVTTTNSYVLAHTTVEAKTIGQEGTTIIDGKSIVTSVRMFKAVAPHPKKVSPVLLTVLYEDRNARQGVVTLNGLDGELASMVVNVVDGKFPNYRSLIPEDVEPKQASDLARAKKAEIVAYLSSVGASGHTDEKITKAELLEKVDAHYQRVSGPDQSIVAIDPERLKEIGGTVPGARFSQWLRFQVRGPLASVVVTSNADKAWTGLIMPVRQ